MTAPTGLQRWTLPDLPGALAWCSDRADEGIRGILHPLGEFAQTEQEAQDNAEAYIACATAIADAGLDASIAVKPTAIGISFDRDRAAEIFVTMLEACAGVGVPVECDMEGTPTVPATLRMALAAAEQGHLFTITLQSYLTRTAEDIAHSTGSGLTVRLVKGAYLGDLRDREEIRSAYRTHLLLLARQQPTFRIGTLDRSLIRWAEETFPEARTRIEFGLLKGIGERTAVQMAEDGWRVAQYIPYGNESSSYTRRREIYLNLLARAGEAPLH